MLFSVNGKRIREKGVQFKIPEKYINIVRIGSFEFNVN